LLSLTVSVQLKRFSNYKTV